MPGRFTGHAPPQYFGNNFEHTFVYPWAYGTLPRKLEGRPGLLRCRPRDECLVRVVIVNAKPVRLCRSILDEGCAPGRPEIASERQTASPFAGYFTQPNVHQAPVASGWYTEEPVRKSARALPKLPQSNGDIRHEKLEIPKIRRSFIISNDPGSSNGRTAASEVAYRGSSP
jgi:hypothetical protein